MQLEADSETVLPRNVFSKTSEEKANVAKTGKTNTAIYHPARQRTIRSARAALHNMGKPCDVYQKMPSGSPTCTVYLNSSSRVRGY